MCIYFFKNDYWLRVTDIELLNSPNFRFEMDSQVYAISKDIMEGTGEGLFDHIAECLAIFTKDRGIEKEILPLGFTFSFPCRQIGLDVGELITWTKGTVG